MNENLNKLLALTTMSSELLSRLDMDFIPTPVLKAKHDLEVSLMRLEVAILKQGINPFFHYENQDLHIPSLSSHQWVE